MRKYDSTISVPRKTLKRIQGIRDEMEEEKEERLSLNDCLNILADAWKE